jgi:hypothetical protein
MRKHYLVLAIAISILTGALSAEAGTGTFVNGEFNFCVSIRFKATDQELVTIRNAFQEASQILADATDGQHRFGTIHLVNNSGASDVAEYWIHGKEDRANAPINRYGKSGHHVNLFIKGDFNGSKGDAYTIAHEHAHHAYGVWDEYLESGGECAARDDTGRDSPTLNFCLMDDYFKRGIRGVSPLPDAFSLNEFCVAQNHDPNRDTDQHKQEGKSCWETISERGQKHSAKAPSGLPVEQEPAPHSVDMHDALADLRAVLIIDRSGSMFGNRIAFAKQAARVYVNAIDLVNLLGSADPQFGLASFSDNATLNQPLTTDGDVVKTAVNGLSASGNTNIGSGLQTGLGAITSAPSRSCREIMVLLSDGDHNIGTHPAAVIPSIVDENVVVFTVGVGSGISTSGQQTLQAIANETGGRYLNVTSDFGLVRLFLQLSAEASGAGVIGNDAPFALSPTASREASANIEVGASEAMFAVAVEAQGQLGEFKMISPSGRVIDFDASAGPDISKVSDTNYRLLKVTNPEPGQWKTRVIGSASAAGGLAQTFTLVNHDGTKLLVVIEEDSITAPDPLFIEAHLQFEGENVLNAELTGEVTRPDGSRINIFLVDDGTNGDRKANDAVYSTRFKSFNGEGSYSVNVTGHSSSASRTVDGEELFSFLPSNSNPVPSFTRSGSASAIVTGSAASADRLQNLATRMFVMNGNKVLIGGFIVVGTGPKKVLLRATGPSLNSNGAPISDHMADPTLTLYDQNGVAIALNDDWQSAPEPERTEIETSGLKPENSREAAILRSLSPGHYTAIVRGKGDATGIAMLEMFDRDPTGTSEFGNISTRGFVSTQDKLMIGGAIVGGGSGGGVPVIIRGIGPTLHVSGVPVPERLSDPELELFDANGSSIASNNDWKTTQEQEINATGLAPTNDAEAAIVTILPAGATTAHLRGNGDSSGIGLIEIYALPSSP